MEPSKIEQLADTLDYPPYGSPGTDTSAATESAEALSAESEPEDTEPEDTKTAEETSKPERR
jgi:hypothetical protein